MVFLRSVLFLFFTVSQLIFPMDQSSALDLDIHFIDVGQGDSILIKTPSEQTILIDGGPREAGKRVVHYLQQQGVTEIDLVVATHPDIDHIGGLLDVLDHFPVRRILDSGKHHTTKTYKEYVQKIWHKKIPVQIAKLYDYIKVDPEVTLQVLNTSSTYKTNNNSSIVLRMTYKDLRFLFMGDLEKEAEKRLTQRTNIEADIIKIAHHGSNTSSSLSFLQRVNPKIAILTYGRENEFGHPVPRVIEHLQKINAQIYSTAVYGDLHIITDGEGYFILPKKSPLDHLAS